MLLTADVGNTNITLGVFEGDNFVNEYRIPSDKDLSSGEYEVILKSLLSNYQISGCVLASVVEELNIKFKHALENVLKVNTVFVSCDINLGLKIVADNPYEVGADRIANAVFAVDNFKGKSVIVVDFGTATTFDIVNSNSEFCGGIIAPGIKTQLKSLKSSTSKLPNTEVTLSKSAIGHNTTEAILSGVIRGCASMVDGLIAQCEQELGEKVILLATGGYCGLISNYMTRKFDLINPILTLEGLKKIYNLNVNDKLLAQSITKNLK